MKMMALVISGVVAVVMCARVSGAERPAWHLHVVLVDGSRIIGVPKQKSITVDVGFSVVQIPMERIRCAEFRDSGKTIRIELNNDDVLTGALKQQSVEIKTIFGTVLLETKHFDSFQVRPSNLLGWLPTTRGLTLYYSFDRVGDGVVTNLAGSKHLGRLNGSSWVKDGKRGGAIELKDRTRIEVPHDPDLCPRALTLALWIKPTGSQSGYQVIVGKTEASSWHGGYGLVRLPGNEKMVHFFVNGYTDSVVKTEIPKGVWSHIAGVCDGKTVSIYRDGILMSSMPVRGAAARYSGSEGDTGGEEMEAPDAPGCSPPSPVSPSQRPGTIRHTSVPLYIGSDARGYAWNGEIDELVLYRRALSEPEIRRLFEAASNSM
jgi:hypothetical protein